MSSLRLGPLTDVPTRWNSELEILKQLQKFVNEVNLALPAAEPEHLNEGDWKAIELAVEFLNTPALITTKIEVRLICCR